MSLKRDLELPIINLLVFGNCFFGFAFGFHDCIKPENPEGTYFTPVKTTYNVTEKINYSCYGKYAHRIGNTVWSCLPNGTWSESTFYCGCLKPAFPLGNGTFSPIQEFYKVTEVVRYECSSSSWYLFGDSIRTCLENGSWSGQLPYCVKESDLKLVRENVQEHILIDGKKSTCLTYNEKNKQIFFQLRGKSKNIIVRMFSNRNDERSNVYYYYNHKHQYKDFKYESWKTKEHYSSTTTRFSHQFTYNSSTILENPVVAIRVNDCTKQNSCFICEVIVFTDKISNCPRLHSPNENTFIRFDKEEISNNNFEYGSAAIFTCSEGFKLNGQKIHRCDLNSVWRGGDSYCQAIECHQSPPALKNGMWPKWRPRMIYSYNSTLKAVCKHGYTNYSQPLTITCSSRGTWLPHLIEDRCQAIRCSNKLPALKNGFWPQRNFSNTIYSVNDTIDAVCNSGYINYGQPIRVTCSPEGAWSPYLIEDPCQEIKCAGPSQAIQHGYWSMKRTNETFTIGSTLEAICKYGFKRTGTQINITCITMDNWTHSDVECTAIVIIPITVSGLILVLFCLGCCIFWTRRNNQRRSQKRIKQGRHLLENPVYSSASYDQEQLTSTFLPETISKDSTNQSILNIKDELKYTEMVNNEIYLAECPIAKPIHVYSPSFNEKEDVSILYHNDQQRQPFFEREVQDIVVENEIYSTE